MSRIISVVGRKGGVAKTTSTVHLAAHLASLGFKTCIIDYDTSQSNSTRSLIGPFWEAEDNAKGICSVINDGGSFDDVIRETSFSF